MTNKPLTNAPASRTAPIKAGPTPDMIELLGWIAKVGVRADERELLYQLRKHGHGAASDGAASMLQALADLEARGLVSIFLCAELTRPGWETVHEHDVDLTDETSFRPFAAPALEAKAEKARHASQEQTDV